MSNSGIVSNPSRRSILAASLAAAGGVIVTSVSRAAAPTKPAGFRFAHLTDMHVKPESGAPEGYAKALQSLAKVDPPPQFIITGGDHVMDALEKPRDRVNLQWDVYDKVFRENTKLKSYPVIGNHDVWGWMAKENWDAESGFGKAVYLERMQLPKSYYSFDSGAWHFIVLDNISRREKAYFGQLDDEQTEWLKGELAAHAGKKPVCVLSHIPLVAICALFFGYGNGKTPKEFWRVGDNMMHHNVKPLLKILAAGNVKLCISGHVHLLDRVNYLGMSFICDGAVSGNWWGGPFQEVSEGYGIFDLFDDGTFEHQYVTYGWEARRA